MRLSSDQPQNVSRRELLQAAGGVTLCSLVPRVSSAETEAPVYELPTKSRVGGRPPVFTALPYLQPGPSASKLVEGNESIVIAWQTDNQPASFELSFGEHSFSDKAQLSVIKRDSFGKDDGESRVNYAATLTGLKLHTKYRYRVSMDGETFMEGFFTTRKPRGVKTRFVAFGDNSYGDISDRAIAYLTHQQHPDFVMNAGDNVYESGLDNEYARYFFPVYNADQLGPRSGSPLLRSVPFYTVIANHDVHDKDAQKHPIVDFTKNPDSLGYFTNMHLPLNGPKPSQPVPTTGNPAAFEGFKKVAGDRFPSMANYSFDYGDAHFLCLDANVYVDPTDAALQAWIESDLAGTDAAWKFVVYHHPAFNVGDEHYHEQQMRVLSPILEKHGVVLVFTGHEHTYQRTRPLKFAPKDLTAATQVGKSQRLVPGVFTIDRAYDGQKQTKPQGVIYLTTGAGGKHLYDAEFNHDSKNWLHEEDDNADYVTRFISDRHSITVIDMDATSLVFRQIDEWGAEVDQFRIDRSTAV